MWTYDKKLQFPVNIKQTNSKLAKAIITQYGGADGELGASLRYLSQRISTPYDIAKGVLTDVGSSVSEMFQTAQTLDKPCVSGLFVHSIITTEKLKKYNSNADINIDLMNGETKRIINLFIA